MTFTKKLRKIMKPPQKLKKIVKKLETYKNEL